MKPQIGKAVTGGIVATIVMTLMMMFVAPMMTGQPMDIAALLGAMLGGYAIGMVAHIMKGVIIFPLIYVFIYGYLPGSPVVRGLVWGAVLWLMAAAVVMPMAGAGFFMANIGGMMAAIAALVGHLVYGGLLGWVAGEGAAPATA